MMSKAMNPVTVIDGVVHVTDDHGKTLAVFAGHNLDAWRKFQLDMVHDFHIVVADKFMPVAISSTIVTPNKRTDEYVPSGG